ncbi:MAG TPA: TonB-dependent receptor [Gammaproteobacteria bacterium]|nr:TonB-dependent receptor [Gammaproteobacteria bacterium]
MKGKQAAAGFVPGRKSSLSVAVMLALGGAQTVAYAQDDAEQQSAGAEEVVITTGTRLRNTGMDMPNPVTVVTREEIAIIAPTNLIEGLAELPQFYGSATTQNPDAFFQSTGAGSLNLRGLQSKRTLQLLDGRRVVQSTIFGGPDINLFPENVVRTVETVTGGATAAYGTDAVAGVVNFVLDTGFEGFRGNFSTGQNDKGHGDHYEASFGAGFALGDNTHLLVNLEKSEQDPIWGEQVLEYDWYRARALLNNPDPNAGDSPSNPFYVAGDNVRSSGYSGDGLFHFTAAQGGPQILDSSGNPSAFVEGSPCSLFIATAYGCSTTNGGSPSVDSGVPGYAISPDSGRENIFGYIEHEFESGFTLYGQAISGEAEFTSKNIGGLFPYPPIPPLRRNFTIHSGNPFLPAAIQAQMDANGLASVPFSRIGMPEDIAFDAHTQQTTETDSLTGGFEYEFEGDGFFDGWLLRGYYQSGETDVKAIQRGGIRLDRIFLAADVVLDGSGQPACNVTVTTAGTADPLYQDCVPLNLFGRGQASPEAVDWVTGFEAGVPINAQGFLSATESLPHSYISGENKQRVINIQQDVWEVAIDGVIAEGWAGPITMAMGYGFREESFAQVVEVGPGGNINADPRFRPVMANDPALGIRGVPGGNAASGNSVEIQFSNVPFARGEQDVKEAFTEFLVPLVADRTGVRQLNFSGAMRWADYSGAGQVQSWKTGLDWAIVDSLRLRTTVSQDVRAATMGEKFDRTGGLGNVTDYLLDPGGGLSYGITIFSNGSPDIKPENAKTKTVGFVFQPVELRGLSVSMDWYTVEVTDNIQQSSAASVVEGCYVDNDPFLCSLITRGGPPSTEDPSINYISLVGVPFYNQAAVEATGIDFEVNYRRDVDWFGGGETVNMRLLGSWLDERNNVAVDGSVTELAGSFGLPEWTSVIQGGYNRGPLSLGLSVRYADSMIQNRNWNFNGNSARWDVADNEIASETLVDARFNYQFETGNGDLGLFFNINNLFDEGPEEFLGIFSSNFSTGTGLGVTGEGDRGRRYTVGVRLDF